MLLLNRDTTQNNGIPKKKKAALSDALQFIKHDTHWVEVSNSHIHLKSLMKTNNVHFVNKLLEGSGEFKLICSGNPSMTRKTQKKRSKVCFQFFFFFSCCLIFTTPAWSWRTRSNKLKTYIQKLDMSSSPLPVVRKEFKKLRNFLGESSRVNFCKYIGRVKLQGGNSREISSIIFSLACILYLYEACESVSSFLRHLCFSFNFFCSLFCRNCAHALSIT